MMTLPLQTQLWAPGMVVIIFGAQEPFYSPVNRTPNGFKKRRSPARIGRYFGLIEA
jgi:hypothetical protein